MQMKFGSDLIIDIIKQYQVDYVAFNPGASFRGLHDSLVNYANNQPALIMCCHEEIAVAIAHGYAKASNKIMAVFIHANIGLQHASMAIFNAWCDRVPILLIGGIGPMDANLRRPWIEWIHTSNHHDVIIRDYVKWCDQPYSLKAAEESLHRAFQLLQTEPAAPVYLAIDCDIQEAVIHSDTIQYDKKRMTTATVPHPDPDILQQIARELLNAKNPIIIADYYGKSSQAVDALLAFATRFSIPVIDRGGRFNFPTNHPLNLTGVEPDYYRKIDYILCLDVQDLWGALGALTSTGYHSYVNHETPIIHVSLSNYLVSKWVADYQKLYHVALTIQADSVSTLSGLKKICDSFVTNHHQIQFDNRLTDTLCIHQQLRNNWINLAKSKKNDRPLSSATTIYEIGQAIKDEQWVLTNGGSLETDQWAKRLWDFERAGSHIGHSGGAGLGYGLSASIGAALAHKNTGYICINLQADGDLLFTPSALWTAAHYDIPLLIIVMNNRSYNNSKEHALKVAQFRERNVMNAGIGTDFTGLATNFKKLAQSFGLEAFDLIETADDIVPTIKKAIHYIKNNHKPCLVDILIQ